MNRRQLNVFILFLICLLSFSWQEAQGERLDHWRWINPLPQGNTLYAVAYGNSMFVAAGWTGTIVTSPDGFTWTTRLLKNTGHVYAVIYANNKFVAIGQGGAIVTSSDGVYWCTQSSGNAEDLLGITYGNNLFVVVGENGAILTSPDGQNWTTQVSGTVSRLRAVAYGNGTFIAVGGDALISKDGIKWTMEERDPNDGGYYLTSIIYDNKIFTASGYWMCGVGQCLVTPGTSILTSPDGDIWSEKAFIDGDVNNFIHDGDKYVAVGSMGHGGSGATFTSIDGITWEEKWCTTCGYFNLLNGIAYGNNSYIAVGDKGIILISPDGITWFDGESRVLRRDARLNDIAYGHAGFVAVGGLWMSPSISYDNLGPFDEGYVPILTSPDGSVWTARNSGISWNKFNVVAYGKDTYVIGGGDGLLLTSPNGIDWTVRRSETDYEIYALAYGNDRFVAVINGSAVLTSTNGMDWIKTSPENVILPDDMVYGGGLFIAVGYNGAITTTPDGVAWTKRDSGTSSWLKGISYGNNKFVAVGNNGTIIVSSDGIDWAQQMIEIQSDLTGIDFVNGTFVIYGGAGTILTSTDGANWTVKNTITPSLCGMAFGGNDVVAVGCYGDILKAAGLELTDAIFVMQILSEKVPDKTIFEYTDTDANGVISLQDLVFIMQSIAGLR